MTFFSKKKCFTLLWVIAPACLFAQEKVNDFEMSYFEKPSFDISATEDKGEISYYISMYSMEGERSPVVLMIDNESELDNFITDVQTAAQTYAKWDSVSVVNNVMDLDKEMTVSSPGMESAFHYGSSWNFDYSTTLTYNFKHVSDSPRLIIRTGKLQSGSNQYIDSDGGVFVFSSLEEIDDFVSALELQHAKKYFSNKANKEDLFED